MTRSAYAIVLAALSAILSSGCHQSTLLTAPADGTIDDDDHSHGYLLTPIGYKSAKGAMP